MPATTRMMQADRQGGFLAAPTTERMAKLTPLPAAGARVRKRVDDECLAVPIKPAPAEKRKSSSVLERLFIRTDDDACRFFGSDRVQMPGRADQASACRKTEVVVCPGAAFHPDRRRRLPFFRERPGQAGGASSMRASQGMAWRSRITARNGWIDPRGTVQRPSPDR